MTDNQHRYCVIMAGDIGKSSLALAYNRLLGVVPKENILVITPDCYGEQVKRELPMISVENILLEPYKRGTAPCIAYAAHTLLQRDPQSVMAALPADHFIGDCDIYHQNFLSAFDYVEAHPVILTLGITPTRPDSNFGYIQAPGADASKGEVVKVKTFTEKPDVELAKVFLDSGEFLWNSGIFFWQASVIRKELGLHAPDMACLWEGWEEFLGTPKERGFLESIYPDMSRTSIDYAVLEKSDNVWMLPVDFEWADIGGKE